MHLSLSGLWSYTTDWDTTDPEFGLEILACRQRGHKSDSLLLYQGLRRGLGDHGQINMTALQVFQQPGRAVVGHLDKGVAKTLFHQGHRQSMQAVIARTCC